jgi:hypothetical protein
MGGMPWVRIRLSRMKNQGLTPCARGKMRAFCGVFQQSLMALVGFWPRKTECRAGGLALNEAGDEVLNDLTILRTRLQEL